MTPLQYAAFHGIMPDTTQMDQASLNSQTLDGGMTALHLSSVSGHPPIVELLLQQGADASITNNNNQLPLFSALLMPAIHADDLKSNKELIFRMLNQATPGLLAHQDTNRDTVFQLMAAHGFHVLLAELLPEVMHLECNPIFVSNNHTKYPIHTAVLNNQLEIAELLMPIPTVGALTDSSGRVALHYAARHGSAEMVQCCCSHTADICIADREGKTPLMMAQEAENALAMKILSDPS